MLGQPQIVNVPTAQKSAFCNDFLKIQVRVSSVAANLTPFLLGGIKTQSHRLCELTKLWGLWSDIFIEACKVCESVFFFRPVLVNEKIFPSRSIFFWKERIEEAASSISQNSSFFARFSGYWSASSIYRRSCFFFTGHRFFTLRFSVEKKIGWWCQVINLWFISSDLGRNSYIAGSRTDRQSGKITRKSRMWDNFDNFQTICKAFRRNFILVSNEKCL